MAFKKYQKLVFNILNITSPALGTNTNSPFHSSWKVTKLLHETEVDLARLEKWK